MKLQLVTGVISLAIPFCLFSDQSIYCPQNHAYISVGMSTNEVIAACGQPVIQQDSNKPVLQRIPVQQLIYNNKGTDTAFYGVWNIPTGSGGAQLQINIVDKKVRSVVMNGSDSNAFSICGGTNIQIGDPVGKVYGNCGNPSVVNNTYENQIVPTQQKPQVWIYQPGQYQPSVTLTFVDGKLQSINQ